ncbi:MAG: hypothetical protein DRJ32_00880 [Thermoprotei archaeon]|nr:MAG: hypothetical protein DRJ32_00880 [Thermoprotei archaeon]
MVKTVKTPICIFDAKTRILCAKCQKLYDEGKISDIDIEISHHLVLLENKYPQLKDVVFHKSYQVDNTIFMLITDSKEMSEKLWRKIVRYLERKLERNVKIVRKSSDIKNIISQLIYPARILGLSIIWFPDGTSEYMVRVSRRDYNRLSKSISLIEKAIKHLTKHYIKIVAE